MLEGCIHSSSAFTCVSVPVWSVCFVSGIGRGAALRLAREGASVVVAARRLDLLQQLVKEIEAAGGKALAVAFDAAKEADNKRVVDEAVKHFGSLDIAFNNAGVLEMGPITGVTEAQIDRVFNINCKGVVLGMKYQIPAMTAGGKLTGVIINNSSFFAQRHTAQLGIYSASKAYVESVSKIAAIENAGKLRVNVIAPGYITTSINADSPMAALALKNTLAHRTGTSQETSDWVVHMASDRAGFITGVVIPVDGGASLAQP